jgi:hypothetical protein
VQEIKTALEEGIRSVWSWKRYGRTIVNMQKNTRNSK